MQKPVEKPIKFIKNLSTKGKSFPITHVSAVIDDNGESVKSTIDSLKNKSSMTEVTWLELKDKRDAGKLIPGSLYRITDYQCTTTQENTKSAGHQFDIVLLALSENKLAEEGWAMEHPTDVYDVTFAQDNVTKKCYLYKFAEDDVNLVFVDNLLGLNLGMTTEDFLAFDAINKTATLNMSYSEFMNYVVEGVQYNYFQNSNLSAWKVWYCLDNDTDRFAWADDSVTKDLIKAYNNSHLVEDYCWRRSNGDKTIEGVNYYYWANDDLSPTLSVFTTTKTPTTNDKFYWFNGPVNPPIEGGNILDVKQGGEVVGRGVIYRLIDEWGNDVAYDFKNIQFIRPMTDGEYDPDGEDTWVYTFSFNNDIVADGSVKTSNGDVFAVKNTIEAVASLNNNVFLPSANNCKVDMMSKSNTLVRCDGVSLHNTFELVIRGTGESIIYLNNKKVLTEE